MSSVSYTRVRIALLLAGTVVLYGGPDHAANPQALQLSGRIVDCNGAPILQTTTVRLLSTGHDDLTYFAGQDARFLIPSVPPNRRYLLEILLDSRRAAALPIEIEVESVELGDVVIQPPCLPSLSNLSPKSNTVHILARVTDENSTPLAPLTFRDLTAGNRQISTVQPNAGGWFVFPATGGDEYQFGFAGTNYPATFRPMAKVEVAEGDDIDLGRITVQSSPHGEFAANLAGPVAVHPSVQSRVDTAIHISTLFIRNDGIVNVIQDDGRIVGVPNEKDQVGSSSPRISADRKAAGWLIDSPFCCTSYPLDFTLVVYRAGKPLQRFKGDGRAIFRWQFVNGGKQVAFYQDFPHGIPHQHYECRDAGTGRLMGEWEGNLTVHAPPWTRGFPH